MAADTEIVSVAIDPKGTYIAAGEADGDVTVWDISGDEGRLFFSLPGHSGFVEDLAFSPDGKLLASAGADTMVKVWDLSPDAVVDQTAGDTVASREMLALSAHHDIVVDVLFSPDGKRLISASQDGTVRVYTLDLEELVELARDRVTRGLTTEECQRYLHVDSCPERGS
jgi:WD40 repeat protein